MPINKNLPNLVINRVPTKEIYKKLKERNMINEDELYLVDGDDDSSDIGIVQSDWKQNDETAADYVKHRTHYEYNFTEVEIIPETTMQLNNDTPVQLYDTEIVWCCLPMYCYTQLQLYMYW